MSAFTRFQEALSSGDTLEDVRAGLIGHDVMIHGPYGPKRMVYADYVASGRALRQIEDCVMQEFLPLYANSHTEASHAGSTMTALRREARAIVGRSCGTSDEHAVIFSGAGATHGINRLVHLFGLPGLVAAGQRPVVLIGPYEHHSNILPWRESGAEVIEIPEGEAPGPCPQSLEDMLQAHAGRPIVASFSAASNITGALSDIARITQLCKAAGVRVVWDYAGGAPYLPIQMSPAPGVEIDAITLSTHKFVGGPQASGVLMIRKDAVRTEQPTLPGGGTVRFVSPHAHDYSGNIEAREEAGTPNVIGDLRVALCFLVKDAIGAGTIAERNTAVCTAALDAWTRVPEIELLGRTDCPRLPIFSFRVRDGQGGYVHQQLVTRMLSDLYGIQARGGCACAGPYVHRLLGIDEDTSAAMRAAILAGDEIAKPGFVRLNFSYLADDAEVAYIIQSVAELARTAPGHVADYVADTATAIFRPAA